MNRIGERKYDEWIFLFDFPFPRISFQSKCSPVGARIILYFIEASKKENQISEFFSLVKIFPSLKRVFSDPAEILCTLFTFFYCPKCRPEHIL